MATPLREPVDPASALRPSTTSWAALAQQLLEAYPAATISEVVRELRRARETAEELALADGEALRAAASLVQRRLAQIGRG